MNRDTNTLPSEFPTLTLEAWLVTREEMILQLDRFGNDQTPTQPVITQQSFEHLAVQQGMAQAKSGSGWPALDMFQSQQPKIINGSVLP